MHTPNMRACAHTPCMHTHYTRVTCPLYTHTHAHTNTTAHEHVCVHAHTQTHPASTEPIKKDQNVLQKYSRNEERTLGRWLIKRKNPTDELKIKSGKSPRKQRSKRRKIEKITHESLISK